MQERVEFLKYEDGVDMVVVECMKTYQNCKFRKDKTKTWTFKPMDASLGEPEEQQQEEVAANFDMNQLLNTNLVDILPKNAR